MSRLKGTLTIRLSKPALRRLKLRAKEIGSTPSDIVRSLLQQELASFNPEGGLSAYELSSEWIGRINSRSVIPGRDARTALKGWKPDRRG